MLENEMNSCEDTLRKRYSYKLFANLVGFGFSMVNSVVIPRGLGPVAYGHFSFLTTFFQPLIGFFSLSTTQAFFTKFSQRPDEYQLRKLFQYLALAVAGVTAIFLALSLGFSIGKTLWPGQDPRFICAAALWAYGMWYVSIINKMTDAYALTVQSEKARILQKILACGIILLLFLGGWLSLSTFFIYHYVIILFLSVTWAIILKRNGYSIWGERKLKRKEIQRYMQEFYSYCSPLILVGIIALPLSLFDRWLLQKFAGSTQQGFYSLSYQIGAICFLFTSAMTPLITREFSVAFGKHDLAKMAFLFRRYIPLLCSVAAFFSCFIALQADSVIYLTGGNSYKGAVAAVTIMAFYPIHQTYGQLNSSVFFATGQTKLYSSIGLILMIIGAPVTYFLIAPAGKFGLDAGATGLAIKMVVIQIIGVNVELYFSTRLLGLRFWRYLAHQIGSVGVFLILSFLADLLAEYVFQVSDNAIISFVSSGIVYSILVAGLAVAFPLVFGLSRNDIRTLKQMFLKVVIH
jgi:O-antigen/teichoic acid export membrane protein